MMVVESASLLPTTVVLCVSNVELNVHAELMVSATSVNEKSE